MLLRAAWCALVQCRRGAHDWSLFRHWEDPECPGLVVSIEVQAAPPGVELKNQWTCRKCGRVEDDKGVLLGWNE
jgi:hypothetical protein